MRNASEKLRKIYISLFASPYAIFLVSLILLAVLYFFRGFVMHGQESYFYYRISGFILNNNIPNYDFLSFGGRAFLYSMGSSMFIVLINLISRISIENLLVFIPQIFGFISILLFYFILKHFNITRNVISFCCYILLLSPPFLYSFTHFTSFTIPFFLNVLGFFLIIKNKKFLNYIAFLPYLALPFFEFIHSLFGISLLLFYFYKKKELKRFIPYSFIILLSIYLNNHFVEFGLNIIKHNISEYFFLFGGPYGISIFALLMSFFGFLWLWQKKYGNKDFYLFFIYIFAVIFLNIRFIIYLNLLICILASFGLKYIYKSKWESRSIRNLTVILLIGGIIFSGAFFLASNTKTDPSPELVDALSFLEKRTSPRDVILSHEKYGIYINSISRRKDFIDMNKDYAPRSDLRVYYLDRIFYSKSLTNAVEVFNEFRITHFLITPEMKNGLVWSKSNEGLLFLIEKNPEYFKLIYDENGYQIWRFV